MDSRLYYEFDAGVAEETGSVPAGADEAGRGPLAGPVVAASVVLDPEDPVYGICDSKKLSAKRRDQVFEEIKEKALGTSCSVISPKEIDRLNILQASLMGMRESLLSMGCIWGVALIDGNREVPGIGAQRCVVKGDSRSACIAAASVIAKVTRDRIMQEYHNEFPLYGFDRNKGYPTREHRESLLSNGMCRIHRRSFCRGIVSQTALELDH